MNKQITIMLAGIPHRAEITNIHPDGIAFNFVAQVPPVLDMHRSAYPIKGIGFPEDEGVEWLAGWGDDIEAELRAVDAMRPEFPNFIDMSATATGRMSSLKPNIANYPKSASGKR